MSEPDVFETTTACPEETEALGEALAGLLPRGCVLALRGDLATGKTCLVRGLARHFGTGAPVHSPTFTLVNQYGDDPPFLHLDLYRLSGPEELADLGYEELFDPEGICAVEWAERADGLFPEDRVEVELAHAGRDQRQLRITNRGVLPAGWQGRLAQ